MTRYLFVGERPSTTALTRGWGWKDGRLAAKQLFDALHSSGIDPAEHRYDNVFVTEADRTCPKALKRIRRAVRAGYRLVAMGEKVAGIFAEYEIPCLVIPHPAARGVVRKKAVYTLVVKYVLRGEAT